MVFGKLKQKFGKFRDDVLEPALENLGLKEAPEDPPELRAALDRASKVFEFSAAETELPDELRLPRNLEIRDIVAEEREEISSALGKSANDILIPEMQKIIERGNRQNRWSEFFTPRTSEQKFAELRRQVLLPAYLDADRASAVLNAPRHQDIKEQLEIRLGKKALEQEALKQNPVLRYTIFRLFRSSDPLKFLEDAFGGKVKNLRPTEIEASNLENKHLLFKNAESEIATSIKTLDDLAEKVDDYANKHKMLFDDAKTAKDARNDAETKLQNAASGGLTEPQVKALDSVRQSANQRFEILERKLEELENHKRAFLKAAKIVVKKLEDLITSKNNDKDTNGITEYNALKKEAEQGANEATFEKTAKDLSVLENAWKALLPELRSDVKEREEKSSEKTKDLEKVRETTKEKPSTEQLLYLLIKQEIKNSPGAPKSDEALERSARLGWHLAIGEARESQYVLEANEVRAKALIHGKTPVLKTLVEKTKDFFTHEKPPPLEKHLNNLRRYSVGDKRPFEHFLLKPRYTRNDFMHAIEKDELELKHLQELYLLMGRFIENNRFKMDPEEIGKYQDYMQEARMAYVTLRQKELFEKYKRTPVDKKKDFYKEKMEEEQREEEKLLEEVGPKVLKYLKHEYLKEEDKKEKEHGKEEGKKGKAALQEKGWRGIFEVLKTHGPRIILTHYAWKTFTGMFRLAGRGIRGAFRALK